jgi:hypothetical protein
MGMENSHDFQPLASQLSLQPEPKARINLEMSARVRRNVSALTRLGYQDGVIGTLADQ